MRTILLILFAIFTAPSPADAYVVKRDLVAGERVASTVVFGDAGSNLVVTCGRGASIQWTVLGTAINGELSARRQRAGFILMLRGGPSGAKEFSARVTSSGKFGHVELDAKMSGDVVAVLRAARYEKLLFASGRLVITIDRSPIVGALREMTAWCSRR